MNKELWLLRHGKSDRHTDLEDFLRPLTKRGQKAARSMGAWLHKQQLVPDLILTSPATRALATATQVADELGVKAAALRQEPRLYFQGITAIKEALTELPSNYRRILLVGHNPDLEDLLLELVASITLADHDKLMPTAALARLQIPEHWRELTPDCAKLLSLTLAKQLPDTP